jgi:lipopolysaccharide export system permease protein
MKQIVKDVLSDDPSIIFREKEVLDDVVIHVEPGEDAWSGREIRLVKVDSMNRPVLWAFADRVQLVRDENQLTAELLEVEMEYREDDEALEENQAPSATYPFDPSRASPASFANFPLEIALPSSQPKANEMTMTELQTALKDPALPQDDAAEYRTEMTKRYSISLACLAFCMIGIPLGITTQRRETSIGFALSLAVAVVYFLFIFLGETFGEEDTLLPHALMWSPSVLFIGLGSFLFYRLNKR